MERNEIAQHRMVFKTELRAVANENKTKTIEGHAIVFGAVGETPWYTEEISKSAVENALAQKDLVVAALWNHEMSMPLGKTPDSLELSIDDVGLKVKITPPDVSYASDLLKLIDAGIVTQMSFGFYLRGQEQVQRANDERPHFIVTEMELFDVSPVTLPFYPQTDVSLSRRKELSPNKEKKEQEEQKKEEISSMPKEEEARGTFDFSSLISAIEENEKLLTDFIRGC